MQITNQKKMAAQILKCGVNRVWVDPRYIDQVSGAVQKSDIRELIEEGLIKARPMQGTSRVRARKLAEQRSKGRRRGHGSRKGSSRARMPKKERWMRVIRSQRRTLKGMREDGTLQASEYRYYYRKAKGGSYRSIAHMKANMEVDGIQIGGEE
ncbi:MAG: 50S ribosomal protein L19e [Euryarchaeota archaeon]|nr:50S ribosomal protein L19e [Euryarchaeota archaeon]MEC7703669.1 50S ribosomal protein L19e [Candidatus Thermoplasmatota archaeon]|tara:strand:- start:1667 stop:2125 length:459 start_codon:yes stop_codon:yes gene_type:complete